MAKSKGTHSRRKRTRNAFHEVKGKIVEDVEIKPADHGYGLGIMFQDRTYLSSAALQVPLKMPAIMLKNTVLRE